MKLTVISISQNSAQNSLSAIRDTLVNLMPDNFIGAFVDVNILQLIVLSLLVGIAAGGGEIKIICTIFTDITNIFVKIINFFMNFMPMLIFCSVFTIYSSTASVPEANKASQELRISNKIYSFTLSN